MELTDTHRVLGPRQVHFHSLNQDRQAAADLADSTGERIDDYCDRHRLDKVQPDRVVYPACEAVHVTHQHAIIHADLKPDNILITSSGVPRLVDFGQANPPRSFTSDTAGGAPASLASLEEQAPAPEYTSPEQVTGETITTATDVYALGDLLHTHDRPPAVSFQDRKRFGGLASDL